MRHTRTFGGARREGFCKSTPNAASRAVQRLPAAGNLISARMTSRLARDGAARYYRTMRRHRLVAFFLISFALSWGIPGVLLLASASGAIDISIARHSPLSFLFFWTPALSALIVIGWTQGRHGIWLFLRRSIRGRFKWRWWAAVVVGIPLLKVLAYGLSEDSIPFDMQAAATGSALAYAGLLALLESPLSELGWRGFALPLMQRRMSGLLAAITLGAVWAVWYMPWLLPGTVMNWSLGGDSIPAIVRFFTGAIALSITMTVVFNGSEGSMPLMLLFRWLNSPPPHWELGTHVSYVDTVITITTAVVLIFVLRTRYLSRANLYRKVTPGASYVPER